MVAIAVALDAPSLEELFPYPPGLLDVERYRRSTTAVSA
jgi:hypothetical protein